MSKTVLITGGAGFIGSHLADALLQRGHRVRVLDSLDPQVHGEERLRPDYLNEDAELLDGDVRDADAVRGALAGVDVVFHLAACVGVGQSMYDVVRYTDVNNRGTAVLLEAKAAGDDEADVLPLGPYLRDLPLHPKPDALALGEDRARREDSGGKGRKQDPAHEPANAWAGKAVDS